jgi:aquaporin Z
VVLGGLDVGAPPRFRRNRRRRPRIEATDVNTMRHHWPEYLIEAVSLGLFMMSAALFTTLLRHPASPFSAMIRAVGWPPAARLPMGVAMGLTAAAIIYSPLGRRSGAHMNPAITLTFLRLGKIGAIDTAAYVLAQFVGGSAGILVATWLLRGLPADPAVNYVATVPGPAGPLAAFAAEAAISFGLMLVVLTTANSARLARFTGLFAAMLVAAYITFEDPLSGMSMNPARTLGPAVLAHTAGSLWIYFTAPPAGMLAAAEIFVRVRGRHAVRCAKLHHPMNVRCIFNCGFMETPA